MIKRREKIKLNAREHFILRNLKNYLVHYLIMWGVVFLLATFFSHLKIADSVSDYAKTEKIFYSFVTISITTLTVAIPTCLRTIFAAYEHYNSTAIKEIILDRFPVTLLTLSAFTTLLFSLLAISNVFEALLPGQASLIFYISFFWVLICISFIFIAIEKLVYFTFNSPYAILEKLKFDILTINNIDNDEKYHIFRRELASINDIATTILAYSTGKDDAIYAALEIFEEAHKHYLVTADKNNKVQFKYHMSACKAVGHEIFRMLKAACKKDNEKMVLQILQSYCSMIADAVHVNTSAGHFQDMMDQLSKLQSYAVITKNDEIISITYFRWFFILAEKVNEKDCVMEKYSLITRMLATTLRKATLEGEHDIVAEFFQTIANVNPEFDTKKLTNAWRTVLDRAVFIYAAWLIDAAPEEAEYYLKLIHYYSTKSNLLIPILPMTKRRLQKLLRYEKIATFVDTEDLTKSTIASHEQTMLAMHIDVTNTVAHACVVMYIAYNLGLSRSDFEKISPVEKIAEREMKLLRKIKKDKRQLELSKNLFPEIDCLLDKTFSLAD